mmetsp:Transcript_23041/g.58896  ORF Transcript_23041/g.58896 Transcript_23041/m.58896 type:complete len:332 (-) Transcript_23041:203-1198(-)
MADAFDAYKDPAYDTVSSLRRDPRRNSTSTFHLAGNYGNVDRTGRPTAGQRTFHMGPAQRVVAGQLRYAYNDKAGTPVKLDKSLDPAEILREYRAGLLGAGATPGSNNRAQTAPAGATRATQTMGGTGAMSASAAGGAAPRKIVFWDGMQHHVINAPEGYKGSPSVDRNSSNWRAPHLEHKDIAPGRFLGVVEAPGSSSTKLVAGKHRLMPDYTGIDPHTERLDATKGTGTWLSPRASDVFMHPKDSALTTATRSLADSVRVYGQTYKPIGYKEYEATTKQMDGLGCWEKTQCNLGASMLIGQPSRLMTPFEHTSTRLSLRRPTTAAAGGW